MEMLDIKIVESKKDLSGLRILENLAHRYYLRNNNRCFGIARFDNLPVGYWNGILSKKYFVLHIFLSLKIIKKEDLVMN